MSLYTSNGRRRREREEGGRGKTGVEEGCRGDMRGIWREKTNLELGLVVA